jgi:hypothetical protein
MMILMTGLFSFLPPKRHLSICEMAAYFSGMIILMISCLYSLLVLLLLLFSPISCVRRLLMGILLDGLLLLSSPLSSATVIN